MEVLRKDIIRTWLLPYLSCGSRGPEVKADLLEVVEAILYKLKTGCQWRQLPVKQFFTENFFNLVGGVSPFQRVAQRWELEKVVAYALARTPPPA